MSVYSKKGKGWRYDFTLNGTRHTEAWFKTKAEAKGAEARKREEVLNPKTEQEMPTDTDFLELVNRRLDHVKSYNSKGHYQDVWYHARRWAVRWKGFASGEITEEMVETYLKNRLKVSPFVANKELQYLRALFNFGQKKKLVQANPTDSIEFFPVERRKKYLPPKEDVLSVISKADADTQQYLWAIVLTAARVGEINNLTWDDVDFERGAITLWTRKRKGGNREPREVPMLPKLHEILSHRYERRDPAKPWVFWHTYWDRSDGVWVDAPYKDRKKIMKTLCHDAGVKYFRFHALRHITASILDDLGVQLGVIQRILGHRNRRTTEIYLHSIGESERMGMSRLESMPLFQPGPDMGRQAPTNQPASFWQRKAQRPSRQALLADIRQLGYTGTGRKYGVSDNAVRKWMKAYEKEAA